MPPFEMTGISASDPTRVALDALQNGESISSGDDFHDQSSPSDATRGFSSSEEALGAETESTVSSAMSTAEDASTDFKTVAKAKTRSKKQGMSKRNKEVLGRAVRTALHFEPISKAHNTPMTPGSELTGPGIESPPLSPASSERLGRGGATSTSSVSLCSGYTANVPVATLKAAAAAAAAGGRVELANTLLDSSGLSHADMLAYQHAEALGQLQPLSCASVVVFHMADGEGEWGIEDEYGGSWTEPRGFLHAEVSPADKAAQEVQADLAAEAKALCQQKASGRRGIQMMRSLAAVRGRLSSRSQGKLRKVLGQRRARRHKRQGQPPQDDGEEKEQLSDEDQGEQDLEQKQQVLEEPEAKQEKQESDTEDLLKSSKTAEEEAEDMLL